MSVCVFVGVCLCVHFLSAISQPIGIPFSTQFPFGSGKDLKQQYLKKVIFAELLPFFYISLRFLCKFEERL